MLSCPLCCQSQFSSIDILRNTLINAIHRAFVCPICNEQQHGLDNLAAHLSKHIQVPSEISYIEPTTNDVNRAIQNITPANITNEPNDTTAMRLYSEQNDCRIQTYSIDGAREKVISSSTPVASPVSVFEPQLSSPLIDTETGQENNQIQLFFCHLCACTFRSQDLQQMHMQLVHEINVNHETKATEARTFPTLSVDKVDANALQCNFCAKRFKMIGSLRLHVRMVHGVSYLPQKLRNPRNEYKIGGGGSSNNLIKISANEMRTGDSILEASLAVDALPANQQMPQLNTNNNNQIDYFNNNYGGDSFAKEDTTNGCNNNQDTSLGQLADHVHVHECDICRKRFSTKYFLKKHKRIHTGETPYTCDVCNRTFTFQQSYHRHLSYHTNDRPHICSICGRAFKESSTLYNHQRIHSGEKPFECESCGKCFRQRVSYLVHRRIHTGVMPYNCATCDRKFRYKISLRTHKCTGFTATNEFESPATVNSDNMTFVPNDQEAAQPCSEQTLDEFISESCNRMGIVDHNDTNHGAVYTCENTENDINTNQLAAATAATTTSTTYGCDSFNLHDLPFCDGETINTDLANVTPSMNEIFPQTMDILNALYENC